MNASVLLKGFVIASSLLLMAGFVGYRAGAFGWLNERPVSPAGPVETVDDATGGAAARVLVAPVDAPADETNGKELMYSTKSAPIFVDSGSRPFNATEPAAQSDDDAVIFSSTKSDVIFSGKTPPNTTTPNAAPPPPEPSPASSQKPSSPPQEETIIFSGSKTLLPSPPVRKK